MVETKANKMYKMLVKIKTEYGCERNAKIVLKVGATQIPPSFHQDYYACETTHLKIKMVKPILILVPF